jgi:hypothetical protein
MRCGIHKIVSYLRPVKTTDPKLKALQEELYKLSKHAQEGKVDKKIAADRIMEIREEIEKIRPR